MNQETGKKGYVYILINPAFTGFVKVGKTINEPESRARQLSSGSGVPAPYAVAWDAFVSDCDHVETLIHQQLSYTRSRNDREFFAIPLKKAIAIASKIVAPFTCEDDLNPEMSIHTNEFLPINVPLKKFRQNFNSKTSQEELIEVAEDFVEGHTKEPPDGYPKQISRIEYELLIANPYKFTERELFYEVHVVIRKRPDLHIDSYNIKRSLLVQSFGWGIHRNHDGKLALVAVDSDRYKELQTSVRRTKSYRRSKTNFLSPENSMSAIKTNSKRIKDITGTLFRQNDNALNGAEIYCQLSGSHWTDGVRTRKAIVFFSCSSSILVVIPEAIVKQYIFEPFFCKAINGYSLKEEFKAYDIGNNRISLKFSVQEKMLNVFLLPANRSNNERIPLMSMPRKYWSDVALNETESVSRLINYIQSLYQELADGEGVLPISKQT